MKFVLAILLIGVLFLQGCTSKDNSDYFVKINDTNNSALNVEACYNQFRSVAESNGDVVTIYLSVDKITCDAGICVCER